MSNEKTETKNGGQKSATNGKASKRKISAKLSVLQDIVALMDEGGLSELHYEKGDVKIHMKRGSTPEIQWAAPPPVAVGAATPAIPAATGTPPAAEEGTLVKSPMVGTYYRAPAPDAKPFIQEGSRIEVGQVFCIIEAMKLMNEIKSEVSGKVVKILVENGQVVEFGQPLFVLDPQG